MSGHRITRYIEGRVVRYREMALALPARACRGLGALDVATRVGAGRRRRPACGVGGLLGRRDRVRPSGRHNILRPLRERARSAGEHGSLPAPRRRHRPRVAATETAAWPGSTVLRQRSRRGLERRPGPRPCGGPGRRRVGGDPRGRAPRVRSRSTGPGDRPQSGRRRAGLCPHLADGDSVLAGGDDGLFHASMGAASQERLESRRWRIAGNLARRDDGQGRLAGVVAKAVHRLGEGKDRFPPRVSRPGSGRPDSRLASAAPSCADGRLRPAAGGCWQDAGLPAGPAGEPLPVQGRTVPERTRRSSGPVPADQRLAVGW